MSEVTSGSKAKMDVAEHGLKKHKMKVSTIVFMIFCLVAAGAYGIEEMIPESGPGLTLIMLIVLPFVWGLPFGLIVSELGAARPQEGGYYKWVQEAFGEFWGFQAGWWRTISIYIDNSLYVILAGGYVASAFDLTNVGEFVIKAAIIIIFTYINIRGVKDVGIVSTILALLVVAAFAMVAICGFMNWQHNPFIPLTADGTIMGFVGIAPSEWIYYIGMGISIGLWMYAGYESMSTIAGEVEDPQVIPKATLIAIPLIMAVYILPTIAGLGSLGNWPNWGTEPGTIGYADVVTTFWGPAFGIFFVIVAVLAQCSIYNTYIASGSRGFFALADDNLAPPILVKCDKKYGVPYIAVLSVGIVNLILCNFAFSVVVVIDVFLLTASYVMVFLSAMVLRKKIPDSEQKFKIKGGYGFLCFIAIMPCVIAFCAFFLSGTDYFIGGMIGILTGPLLYIFWKKRYGGLAKKDAVEYPLNPKTGLAVGDIKRMSLMMFILGIMGAIGTQFLPWFEGDGGNDYYFETYGFEGFFDTMMSWIQIATVVVLIGAVILFLVGKKIEPSKK